LRGHQIPGRGIVRRSGFVTHEAPPVKETAFEYVLTQSLQID